MKDFIGRTLGHHHTVEKIDVGGMGEAYRTHEERLEGVSIMVLLADLLVA
jgi:hypothetical protein